MTPQGSSDNDATNTPPPPEARSTWSRLHLWQMQPVRDVLLGLGVFAIFWLGQKTSVVTVPLLLAILLAYLFEPVIAWAMSRFGTKRRTTVSGLIAFVVLVVVIPSVIGATFGAAQIIAFGQNILSNYDTVSEIAQSNETVAEAKAALEAREVQGVWPLVLEAKLADQESEFGKALDAVDAWLVEHQNEVAQTISEVGFSVINKTLAFFGALFGLSFMGFLTAFFFYFVSTEWVQFKGFTEGLLPTKNRDRILDLLTKFDAVISGFIRGRITIAFIQAIVFSIGYFAIGVPGAFILGPAVAILSIVPYLALVGLPISVSLLWLEGHDGFRGEWWWVVGAPTALYFLGQALDDYVWTPLIQGKSTGMDTPTILFASIAGGALFGVFGLLIAIPIAACVKILIQEILWPEFKKWAEGRAEDPLPLER